MPSLFFICGEYRGLQYIEGGSTSQGDSTHYDDGGDHSGKRWETSTWCVTEGFMSVCWSMQG